MDGAIRAHSWSENLRTIELDGEPWFAAKDACRCLDLSVGKAGVARYLTRLDASERQVIRKTDRHLIGQIDEALFHSSEPWLTFISESGLYKLTLRSDKQQAKAFQDWVTKEVLPAIRRTGGYLLNEAARETAHADTRTAMP